MNEFPTTIKTVYMSADSREGSEEDESIKVKVKAKDGTLQADLTFTYSFDAEKIAEVQKKYMGDGDYIVNDILRGQIRAWVSEATSQFSTMEIHQTKTQEVNDIITEHVKQKAEKYGVTIGSVSLSETKPPKSVLNKIAEIANIDQEVSKAEGELRKKQAELKTEQAQTEIELEKARREKEVNEEKSKGLTPEVLKQQAIEAWRAGGSQVPQVTNGSVITNLK